MLDFLVTLGIQRQKLKNLLKPLLKSLLLPKTQQSSQLRLVKRN